MATIISNNYLLKKSMFLDARSSCANLTALKNLNSVPSGFICWVNAEQKLYVYNSANSVDPTLGKWRELIPSSDGGGLEIGYYDLTSDKFYSDAAHTTEIAAKEKTLYWDITDNSGSIADGLYKYDSAAAGKKYSSVKVVDQFATDSEVSTAATAVFS